MTPKSKHLLIDMDGVLSDIYRKFIQYEFNDTGLMQTITNLTGKSEREAFKNHDKYVNSENFFSSALPIKGSVEIVQRLNDIYEVYIVSAATQFPLSLTEKLHWLGNYFSFISWQQIVFCGTKRIIKGDIMIDDHLSNLDYFEGQTILFTQPHNSNKPVGKHTRVEDWKEVETLLL